MAKQDQVKEGINDLIGGDKKPQDTKKEPEKRSVGVYLEIDLIDKLDDIAEELEQPRSQVMTFAIADFIRRYEKGDYKAVTETRTETIKTLRPADN